MLLETVAFSKMKMRARCNDDLISEAHLHLAEERIRWVAKCFKKIIEEEEEMELTTWINNKLYKKGNPALGYKKIIYFPIFTDATMDKTWIAPKDRNANCNVPSGYMWQNDCKTGCYTGGMRLSFLDGDIRIIDAIMANQQDIMVLDDGATLDDVFFTFVEVDSYMQDIKKVKQTILVLKMESGGVLEITPNHPVVVSSGEMVEAANLSVGQQLVRQDGSGDPIVEIEEVTIFDKVYNVYPDATSQNKKIVVAEGYLNGSAWYQNEDHHLMNRKLLRRNMSVDLIK